MNDRWSDKSPPSIQQASQFDRVDRICDAYEREWLAGRRPDSAEFLAMAPQAERAHLQRELELIEQDYGSRHDAAAADTAHREGNQDTDRPLPASCEPLQPGNPYRIAHLLS